MKSIFFLHREGDSHAYSYVDVKEPLMHMKLLNLPILFYEDCLRLKSGQKDNANS